MRKKLTVCLLLLALTMGLALPAAADTDGSAQNYTYTFSAGGTEYSIGALEWEKNSAMPVYFQTSYDPNSGTMKGTDDAAEWEFVICIGKKVDGSYVPAGADIFAKVKGVSYTLEGDCLDGSLGTVAMSGNGYPVSRNTMEGKPDVSTYAFKVNVPANTYIKMDAIVTITLDLEGEGDTVLTQRFNIQKIRGNGMGDRYLPIPEGTSAEKLKEILQDREHIWTYYKECFKCTDAQLTEAVKKPLWIYLPAGNFGEITMDVSSQGFTVENTTFNSSSPISIVGSDKAGGTTFSSLDYVAEDSGMSNIGNIRFIGKTGDGKKAEYGLKIAAASQVVESYVPYGCVGVNGCTFNGYQTAVSIGKGVDAGVHAYASIYDCKFENNDIAVYINSDLEGTYLPDGSQAYVGECSFVKNGTGVYLQDLGAKGSPYSFRVTGCDFIGNQTDMNYQHPGTFYLLNNFYAGANGAFKRGAAVQKGASTTIWQGIWRTHSFASGITGGHGVTDGGFVFNASGAERTALTDEYLDDVSFSVITDDGADSETVGTWSFE